jgi:hypothetical protein
MGKSNNLSKTSVTAGAKIMRTDNMQIFITA